MDSIIYPNVYKASRNELYEGVFLVWIKDGRCVFWKIFVDTLKNIIADATVIPVRESIAVTPCEQGISIMNIDLLRHTANDQMNVSSCFGWKFRGLARSSVL